MDEEDSQSWNRSDSAAVKGLVSVLLMRNIGHSVVHMALLCVYQKRCLSPVIEWKSGKSLWFHCSLIFRPFTRRSLHHSRRSSSPSGLWRGGARCLHSRRPVVPFTRSLGHMVEITWPEAVIKPGDRWCQRVGRIQRSLSLSLSSYTDWVPHSLDLSLGLIFSHPPSQLFISLFFISSNLFCSLTHASFYRTRRSPSNLLSALCVSGPLSLVDLLPGVNVHLGWKVHRGSWGLLLVCSGHFLILSRAVTVLVWSVLPISHILICFALASC